MQVKNVLTFVSKTQIKILTLEIKGDIIRESPQDIADTKQTKQDLEN